MENNLLNNNLQHQNILKSFTKKCLDEKIWFALAGKTLLSSLTNEKYHLNDDYLEVFMTFESFELFRQKFPENIIDSTNVFNYQYLNPFYIEPSENILIKINIIVPASIKKSEKFFSLKNKKRQWIGYWVFNKHSKKFFSKVYYKFLSLFYTPLLWQEVYSNIYKEKYEGFFVIDNFDLNINTNWIPSITFDMKSINFLEIECPIIKESELYLIKRFGFDWNSDFKLKEKTKSFNWIIKQYT